MLVFFFLVLPRVYSKDSESVVGVMSPIWRHSCIDSNAIFYQHLHHWHCTLLYCVSTSEVLKDFLLAAIYLEHVFNSLFSSLSSAYFTKAIFTVCWQVFVNVVVSVVVRRQYNVFECCCCCCCCIQEYRQIKLLMMIVMLGSCDFRMAYVQTGDMKVVLGQEKDADNWFISFIFLFFFLHWKAILVVNRINREMEFPIFYF